VTKSFDAAIVRLCILTGIGAGLCVVMACGARVNDAVFWLIGAATWYHIGLLGGYDRALNDATRNKADARKAAKL
jgi:hypothetical protein